MDARIEAIRSHLNEYGDLLEADALFLLDEVERIAEERDRAVARQMELVLELEDARRPLAKVQRADGSSYSVHLGQLDALRVHGGEITKDGA